MTSQELLDDAKYAISQLSKEQRETLDALVDLEDKLASMSMPAVPTEEEVHEMSVHDQQAIIDARFQYVELENRISGMKKRLKFVAAELVNWNDRIKA